MTFHHCKTSVPSKLVVDQPGRGSEPFHGLFARVFRAFRSSSVRPKSTLRVGGFVVLGAKQFQAIRLPSSAASFTKSANVTRSDSHASRLFEIPSLEADVMAQDVKAPLTGARDRRPIASVVVMVTGVDIRVISRGLARFSHAKRPQNAPRAGPRGEAAPFFGGRNEGLPTAPYPLPVQGRDDSRCRDRLTPAPMLVATGRSSVDRCTEAVARRSSRRHHARARVAKRQQPKRDSLRAGVRCRSAERSTPLETRRGSGGKCRRCVRPSRVGRGSSGPS